MPDKKSLDVNRTWHDVREFADKTWNPEVARGVVALHVGCAYFDPADLATYYFGAIAGYEPSTSHPSNQIYVPTKMLVTSAYITSRAMGATGTNEAIPMYLRVNDTDDYLIESVESANQVRLFSTNDLSVVLELGDYFEIKVVCPNWATNPTVLAFGGHIFGWAA